MKRSGTISKSCRWPLVLSFAVGLGNSAYSGTVQTWRDRTEISNQNQRGTGARNPSDNRNWVRDRDDRPHRPQRPNRPPRPPVPGQPQEPDTGSGGGPQRPRPGDHDDDHGRHDRDDPCLNSRTQNLYVDWRGPYGPFTKQRWYYHDVGLSLDGGQEYLGRVLIRPERGTVPLYQCQVMFLGNNDRMIILDEREFASCRGPRELLGFIPVRSNSRTTTTVQRWFDRRDHYVCPKNGPCKAHRLGVKNMEYEFNLCR